MGYFDYESTIPSWSKYADAAKTSEVGSSTTSVSTVTNALTSQIGKLLNGEKALADATKQTSELLKTAKSYGEAAKSAKSKTIELVNEKIQEIKAQAEELNVNIAELAKKAEDAAEYQKQLDEQLEIIDKNQEVINDQNSTKEEKEAALDNITGAQTEILKLQTEIINYSSIFDEKNDKTTEIEESSETLSSEAEQIISNGVAEQQKINEQCVTLNKDIATIKATGVQDKINAQADFAKAAEIEGSSAAAGGIGIIAGSAEAAPYIVSGEANESAVALINQQEPLITTQNSANITTIAANISEIQAQLPLVGAAKAENTVLIGSWNQLAEGLTSKITAWGSDNIESTLTEGIEKITKYIESSSDNEDSTSSKSTKDKGNNNNDTSKNNNSKDKEKFIDTESIRGLLEGSNK